MYQTFAQESSKPLLKDSQPSRKWIWSTVIMFLLGVFVLSLMIADFSNHNIEPEIEAIVSEPGDVLLNEEDSSLEEAVEMFGYTQLPSVKPLFCIAGATGTFIQATQETLQGMARQAGCS